MVADSDFRVLQQRLVDAGAVGIAEIPFPKKKLRRKTSVLDETVEVRTEALQHWLDAILTVGCDHELLDVFMGAQRQMRHLLDENRALQEETVRLARRTEVLAGECDDEKRARRGYEDRLEEVEAARKDAVAKMQDMRSEVRKWQAAARRAEQERDLANRSQVAQRPMGLAGGGGRGSAFDAQIDAALGLSGGDDLVSPHERDSPAGGRSGGRSRSLQGHARAEGPPYVHTLSCSCPWCMMISPFRHLIDLSLLVIRLWLQVVAKRSDRACPSQRSADPLWRRWRHWHWHTQWRWGCYRHRRTRKYASNPQLLVVAGPMLTACVVVTDEWRRESRQKDRRGGSRRIRGCHGAARSKCRATTGAGTGG